MTDQVWLPGKLELDDGTAVDVQCVLPPTDAGSIQITPGNLTQHLGMNGILPSPSVATGRAQSSSWHAIVWI